MICSVSILPVIYDKGRGRLLANQGFHFHYSHKNSFFCDFIFTKFAFKKLFLEFP